MFFVYWFVIEFFLREGRERLTREAVRGRSVWRKTKTAAHDFLLCGNPTHAVCNSFQAKNVSIDFYPSVVEALRKPDLKDE